MKRTTRTSFLLQAVVISALLNLCLVLSGFPRAEKGGGSLFVGIADAIVAPPGIIAKLFAPREHTVHSFVIAGAASLACSFAFYTFLAWAILELFNSWRMRKS